MYEVYRIIEANSALFDCNTHNSGSHFVVWKAGWELRLRPLCVFTRLDPLEALRGPGGLFARPLWRYQQRFYLRIPFGTLDTRMRRHLKYLKIIQIYGHFDLLRPSRNFNHWFAKDLFGSLDVWQWALKITARCPSPSSACRGACNGSSWCDWGSSHSLRFSCETLETIKIHITYCTISRHPLPLGTGREQSVFDWIPNISQSYIWINGIMKHLKDIRNHSDLNLM